MFLSHQFFFRKFEVFFQRFYDSHDCSGLFFQLRLSFLLSEAADHEFFRLPGLVLCNLKSIKNCRNDYMTRVSTIRNNMMKRSQKVRTFDQYKTEKNNTPPIICSSSWIFNSLCCCIIKLSQLECNRVTGQLSDRTNRQPANFQAPHQIRFIVYQLLIVEKIRGVVHCLHQSVHCVTLLKLERSNRGRQTFVLRKIRGRSSQSRSAYSLCEVATRAIPTKADENPLPATTSLDITLLVHIPDVIRRLEEISS